jgi:hypothetical protein
VLDGSAVSWKIDDVAARGFIESLAKVGLKLLIVRKRHNHAVNLDGRSLYADFQLPESAFVGADIDTVVIPFEIRLCVTQHFPFAASLGRIDKPAERDKH